MKTIATIQTDFPTKFGLPRQSGLVESIEGRIVFEKEYRVPAAFKGLEGYSHIWLIWRFSESERESWSPTVRPPRLGGNVSMGVFATRSPFRPNNLGLSCVRLVRIDYDVPCGPVLIVGGIDMMDGTPIYDIKPYVPIADCHPEASKGFSSRTQEHALSVEFAPGLIEKVPENKREALIGILSQDPRPGYEDDPERRYGVEFAGMDVRFHVRGDVLKVCEIVPAGGAHSPK